MVDAPKDTSARRFGSRRVRGLLFPSSARSLAMGSSILPQGRLYSWGSSSGRGRPACAITGMGAPGREYAGWLRAEMTCDDSDEVVPSRRMFPRLSRMSEKRFWSLDWEPECSWASDLLGGVIGVTGVTGEAVLKPFCTDVPVASEVLGAGVETGAGEEGVLRDAMIACVNNEQFDGVKLGFIGVGAGREVVFSFCFPLPLPVGTNVRFHSGSFILFNDSRRCSSRR